MRPVLILDNYDSFTYNLAQLVGGLGRPTAVIRNDRASLAEVLALAPGWVIISPGPGRPEQAGLSVALIQKAPPDLPILGVCLGHQALAVACGGQVVRAPAPVHGETSAIRHNGTGIYRGVPDPLEATRYHSLVVAADGLPACLAVDAWTDDGLVMGIHHRKRPWVGVQFHPESVLTRAGRTLVANFLGVGQDAARAAG